MHKGHTEDGSGCSVTCWSCWAILLDHDVGGRDAVDDPISGGGGAFHRGAYSLTSGATLLDHDVGGRNAPDDPISGGGGAFRREACCVTSLGDNFGDVSVTCFTGFGSPVFTLFSYIIHRERHAVKDHETDTNML